MKTTVSCSILVLAVCVVLASAPDALADVEIVDAAEGAKIFPPDADVEKLADGFQFTEGPVWVGGDGGFLVFSDIPANRAIKWTASGGVSTFRQPSHHTNGHTLDREGRIVAAEHSGRRVSRRESDGTYTTVVDSYQGKKFNSPNDVVVKSDGTYWFTDPPYGLRQSGGTKELDGHFVFRYDPASKQLTVVARDFAMPNGLCFSPDESKLYIADSGQPKHLRVFSVRKDGTLSDGQVFARISPGVPDGIRCDADGRIWSSTGNGAQVFAPDGKLLAKINLPKAGANLCFGGPDGKTLFITARDALYAVETLVSGAAR